MASQSTGPATKPDPFALPSPEVLAEIAAKQDARAKEIRARRAQHTDRKASNNNNNKNKDDNGTQRTAAAELIQRNYRGHRVRRAMAGYSLDPSLRWTDAIKDYKYRTITSPRAQSQHDEGMARVQSPSKSRWEKARAVAQRAGNDDTSESEMEEVADPEQKRVMREAFRKKKSEREAYAKHMGLDYFLEMIDVKHRYGSNLRRYHEEWKKSDTREQFFYWLDEGEGRELDLEDRPRRRLDTEQVRYLSREDRKKYLVRIDGQGRFVWAKDGSLITTSVDFKDSINGIVPVGDPTPTWREVTTGVKPEPSMEDDSDSVSGLSTGSHEDSSKYANEELHDAKGLNKLNHISADSVMNHMLRKTTKKNTWIFVADTSFRIYIGIKQSGAFQHSSFLRGARICAAGLIKIKRGGLRKLSPLSGHYAPPVRNFRGFVRSLKEANADMSHCNISRSYAILLGLEGYVGMKKRAKTAEQGVKDVFNPEEKKRREEAARDKSQSAEKERQILAKQEQEKRERSFSARFMRKLKIDDARTAPEKDAGMAKRVESAPPDLVPGEEKR